MACPIDRAPRHCANNGRSSFESDIESSAASSIDHGLLNRSCSRIANGGRILYMCIVKVLCKHGFELIMVVVL